MQNNKSGGFRRFIRKNGYYLVIGACALAIGISGYFLLRGSEAPEESLSVPVTIEPTDTSSEPPIIPAEDTINQDEAVEDVLAETPEEDETTEEADNLQPEESVPVMRVVVQPVSGDTVAEYSVNALAYNVTTQDWRIHAGVDLAADQGSNVCATEAGTVTAVYHDDYLGTTVEISHASGYTTHYSNLNDVTAVSVGQTVQAGDIIGTVGSTALLEVGHPSHLHFAVTCNGVSMDPAEYFA